MNHDKVLKELKELGEQRNIDGMKRFGITAKAIYGVSMPNIRKLGKKIGNDHNMAKQLWASGIHEARILAGIVDEPEKVTPAQMDGWIIDFSVRLVMSPKGDNFINR